MLVAYYNALYSCVQWLHAHSVWQARLLLIAITIKAHTFTDFVDNVHWLNLVALAVNVCMT
jgi:hypothetical protein